MEFVEVMKIVNRMTKNCTIDCDDCPLSFINNGKNLDCSPLQAEHSEEYERIVTDWAKAHPLKTRMQDFFEKHPNAIRKDDGTPNNCAAACGYTNKCIYGKDDNIVYCFKCWNEPLDE